MLTNYNCLAGKRKDFCQYFGKRQFLSKLVHVLDVSGILLVSDDAVLVIDRDILVNDLVLEMYIVADRGVSADVAALDHGALADDYAAADNRIFDHSVDLAAVGDEGVLDFRFIIVLAGAGIIGSGVDRPVRCEELSGLFRIEKLRIGVIVALEAGDRSEVSEVLNGTDIQIADLGIDDVGQIEHGGDRSCLADQLDQQGFLHNEGLHRDGAYILVAEVAADRVDLVICDIEDVAGLIAALSVVDCVIQSCDVSAGCCVSLKESIVVLLEDHAAGSDHNVLLGLSLDVLKVLIHCPDVGVVDGVYLLLGGRKKLESPALGVDVVVTACSDVCDHGTSLAGNINLLVDNAAVAQVRDREVDDTISSQESEAADGTV